MPSVLSASITADWFPTLPTKSYVHRVHANEVAELTEYMALTCCWPRPSQLCLCLVCGLFWCVEDCASTIEKYESLSTGDRKRVASIASQHLTLKPRNLLFDASVWCRHPGACSGHFGQNISLEAIEVTRLYMGSMLTSHLRA